MQYLRNAWYMAAWDSEVVPDQIVARRYLNEPVVLFRDETNTVRALADICPHRMAPLRRGRLVDGNLQCGYHGLTFDGAGGCVRSPFGAPPRLAVKAYPTLERHSIVWIWMGEPSLADPTLVPDFSFQDPDVAYVGKDYLKVNARYELEIENILDLSHIEHLHPTTLGSGQVSTGKYECVQEGDVVWSNRTIFNEIMSNQLSASLGVPPGERADRWVHVRWNAPANLVIFAGAVPANQAREGVRERPTSHLFTPETDTTSHYWFSSVRQRADGPEGEAAAAASIAYLRVPFETEDAPMLEDQQANVGERDLWTLKWGWLPGDAAGARARKVLKEKIDAEQTLTRAAAPQVETA